MESAEETTVGIAEVRNRKRPCENDGVLRRPLLLDSHENMCGKGNIQRSPWKGRTYKLPRLLQWASRFEVMLNRRMPNGMYGGVRGERKSPLLDQNALMMVVVFLIFIAIIA